MAKNLRTATNSELSPVFQLVTIVNEEESYFLEAIDKTNRITSRLKLIKDNDVLRFTGDDQVTVSCSGCKSTGPSNAIECSIKWNKEVRGFYCTDCLNGDCIKIVSTTSPFHG